MISDPVSEFLFYYENDFITSLSILLDKFGVIFIFLFLCFIYLFNKIKFFRESKIRFDLEKLRSRLFFTFIALLLTIASVQFI
ncbi:MAG: hypothetical protein NZ903_02580, partial [Candidatus Micrarchaeota archaeon]|nr:hypothetical protein [Candidatus Micrarchaeota archaeon]